MLTQKQNENVTRITFGQKPCCRGRSGSASSSPPPPTSARRGAAAAATAGAAAAADPVCSGEPSPSSARMRCCSSCPSPGSVCLWPSSSAAPCNLKTRSPLGRTRTSMVRPTIITMSTGNSSCTSYREGYAGEEVERKGRDGWVDGKDVAAIASTNMYGTGNAKTSLASSGYFRHYSITA